jgi:hypothetical protein
LKHEDLYEDEKIDLDKATKEQLDKYQLNNELIQIIKMDFHGSDKVNWIEGFFKFLMIDFYRLLDKQYYHVNYVWIVPIQVI